jgi:hypothetical protein
MLLKGLPSAVIAGGLLALAAPAYAQQPQRPVSFVKQILPLFQKRCQTCHGTDAKSGLRLDSYESLMIGGDSKKDAIVPGQPDQSRLIRLVEGLEQPRMPPGQAPLTTQERAMLRDWVIAGAHNDTNDFPGGLGADKPLVLLAPKDGDQVREKVKIRVPRSSIPPDGFVGIYIDTRFKAALAPPSAEEMEEKDIPADAPVEWVWDTTAPLSEDQTLPIEDRILGDGPHIIEVKTYKNGGVLAETVRATVNVQNKIQVNAAQPVRLAYGGNVGRQYILEHVVDLEASGTQAGTAGRAGVTTPAVSSQDKILHKETAQYLVSVEAVEPGGVVFWRERRESPLTVVVNSVKQVVRFDTSSRYFSLTPTGRAVVSKVMERESRTPVVNPMELPGRMHRLNQPFNTTLHINLGAYIPATLDVTRLQATLEGMEWMNGERCAKIKADYFAGKTKVDINSVGIRGGDLDIIRGTSTIWFSPATQRVLKAEHELRANLIVEGGEGGGLGGPAFAAGGAGGDFAPGGDAGLGGLAPGGAGLGGAAFGSPYGGGAPGGSPYGGGRGPGGMPFGGGGSPYGGAGMPFGGGGSPYAGMAAGGGFPGMGGGFPGMGGGGQNTGVGNPTTRRFHVNLKVTTRLINPNAKS